MRHWHLLACLAVFWIRLTAPTCAATVHFAGTDSTEEIRSVFGEKTLFLNSADVKDKLHVTVRADTIAGMLLLCTPQNCVPVFQGDSAEVRLKDSSLYVRTDEVAQAVYCTFQVKKKKELFLSCPAGLPSSYVGDKVGDVAPGFRLHADTSTTVALPDLLKHGPLVIVFVRTGDWDPFSKLLLRMLAANNDSLRSLGYQVVGIHGYEAKLGAKWQKDFGVEFPLLSDEYSTVMRAYDVFDRGRLAVPSLFVVGRNGVIRLRHVFDLSVPPDFPPILEQMRNLAQ